MVRIVSDSACDMSPIEAVQKGVRLVPLKTLIDGVEYLDGVTISSEEFYEKLDNCKKLPSTSQYSRSTPRRGTRCWPSACRASCPARRKALS